MDANRKLEYYYFIVERETAEKRELEAKIGSGMGGTNQVNVPTNLPDSVTTKINKEINLEELRKEKRRNKK